MIQYAQIVVFLALYVLVFVLCVVALVDALRRQPAAFVRAGKRTKGFWLAVLGVATAVAFVAIPWPVGIGQLGFLALISAVAAIVYLVDVKPALGPVRRGGSGGQRGGYPGGGW
ncbi:MAG: DUF2516 family protein [Cellulomonadaceae bacterium]|nr:DUF2516 family protein [Cellulomonadaceae bacterium]